MRKQKDRLSRFSIWWGMKRKWQKATIIGTSALCVCGLLFGLRVANKPDVAEGALGDEIPLLGVRPMPQIDRQILWDADDVLIIVDNIADDPKQGMGLRFEYTNNRDSAVYIKANQFTVDKCMANDGYGIIVKPGRSVTDMAFFNSKLLDFVGLHTITECEIGFTVYESEGRAVGSELFQVPTTHIYTTLRNTKQELKTGDLKTVYNSNGVTVELRRIKAEEDLDYDVLVVVTNASGAEVFLTGVDATAVGSTTTFTLNRTVSPKRQSVDVFRIKQRAAMKEDSPIKASFILYDANRNEVARFHGTV